VIIESKRRILVSSFSKSKWARCRGEEKKKSETGGKGKGRKGIPF
jgi:hypothetical protein